MCYNMACLRVAIKNKIIIVVLYSISTFYFETVPMAMECVGSGSTPAHGDSEIIVTAMARLGSRTMTGLVTPPSWLSS